MLIILGLTLIVACPIVLCFTLDNYSALPTNLSLSGLVLGLVCLIVGGVLKNGEIAESDCAKFRAQGTEAYLVKSSCYVKLSENVFTETQGENKNIETRSWVIGHKNPGQ